MPGHKLWAVGEEVLAADFQGYLQNQVVPQFPNVAARDAWAAPPKGALCVVTGTNIAYQYTGAAWIVAPGFTLASVENLTEVGWTAASISIVSLATAVSFLAAQAYRITVDMQWRGTVLNDVHQFILQQGTGPGGDFTTVTALRTWQVSPARASVSGTSEHFFALFPWEPSANVTARLRVLGQRAGGTGSAYVTQSAIEITSKGNHGTN